MFNKIWLLRSKVKNKKKHTFYRKKIKLARILYGSPNKKATINKITITTPRKPNSARRKTVKAVYRFKKVVFSYIPGGQHTLKKFSSLLLKGRGARDLPGVYTKGIRGCHDLLGLLGKTRRRSLYGTKKLGKCLI